MGREPAERDVVEVLYALPDEQVIVTVAYESGLSAAAAVERSGLAERYPEIRRQDPVLGIFGAPVHAEHLLKPGDRVEICRPLKADPRDMRRALVTGGKVMGGAESQRLTRAMKTRTSG
jgi:putative ubiquitin-RnfH superfamily antitoxin RatB of RatAB toxin-antitoxin module